MLIKTYQLAITWQSSRREENRQDDPRAPQAPLQEPRVSRRRELQGRSKQDPENALEALEILGIASRRANANAGDSRNGYLRLERWAVEAALRRRNFDELSSSDIQSHSGMDSRWRRREMAEELS